MKMINTFSFFVIALVIKSTFGTKPTPTTDLTIDLSKEEELIKNSGKKLETMSQNLDPVERIKLLCTSRGVRGIISLGRMFNRMDDDGNKQLNYQEFLSGLREAGLKITDEEAKNVFQKFDQDQSGSVNIDEFLIAIRPAMSENRRTILEEAFKKMDRTGDSILTLADVKNVYSVKQHPDYISGKKTEDEILTTFLKNFEQDSTRDGRVTKEEFMDYYRGISALVDNDEYFKLMIKNAYKL